MNNVRYIIKVTAKAKDNNPNFAGKTNIYLYGKGQMLLAMDEQVPFIRVNTLTNYCVEHYGYKRQCDAIRATKFWNEYTAEHEKFWTYSTEIILKEI